MADLTAAERLEHCVPEVKRLSNVLGRLKKAVTGLEGVRPPGAQVELLDHIIDLRDGLGRLQRLLEIRVERSVDPLPEQPSDLGDISR